MICANLLNIENCIDKFFETRSKTQPIVFFGAGFALKSLLLKFEKYGLNVVGVCDNDKLKQGTYFENRYEILSIEDSISRFPDVLYVISSPLYFWEIKKNLETVIEKERVCSIDFECGYYFKGEDFKSFFIENIDRFEKFYELLNDNISKSALYNVIKAHISGNREDFETACTGTDDWYLFKSLLKPNINSVYVDCGAYDGDTILLFHNLAVNGYKSIFAFEPDESIQLALRSTIADNNISNVQIIKKGAYDFDGNLAFVQEGVYSEIVNSNRSLQLQFSTVEIDVTTVDSILNGNFVDTIKMDIEGSEYKALLGAEQSIKKYKPRLAVCLYHNIRDFVEIPELILNMVPEYRLFLRHHSKGCTDTILYAAMPGDIKQ